MRVVFRAPFDVYSGYGNDAVDIAMFLDKAGVDVLPMPTSILPGLPERFTALLTKSPSGPKDVTLTLASPMDLRPWQTAGQTPVNVGWTMWERVPFRPADLDDSGPWQMPDHANHGAPFQKRAEEGRMFDGLDSLLVTCPMNLDAFSPVNETVPMTVMPCGIDPDKWPTEKRLPDRPMTFLMIGVLTDRKNPFALLEAWRDMKRWYPECDARLHLHSVYRGGVHPKVVDGVYGPDITMSTQALSHQELTGLYLSSDVLVSTARGEGNNKPAMEFMATGGTVIAPRWGGHENWMHADCTYEIDYDLTTNPTTGTMDVDVDHESLVETMYHCWKNRGEVSQKGIKAAPWIRNSLGWPTVVDRLIRHLQEVQRG